MKNEGVSPLSRFFLRNKLSCCCLPHAPPFPLYPEAFFTRLLQLLHFTQTPQWRDLSSVHLLCVMFFFFPHPPPSSSPAAPLPTLCNFHWLCIVFPWACPLWQCCLFPWMTPGWQEEEEEEGCPPPTKIKTAQRPACTYAKPGEKEEKWQQEEETRRTLRWSIKMRNVKRFSDEDENEKQMRFSPRWKKVTEKRQKCTETEWIRKRDEERWQRRRAGLLGYKENILRRYSSPSALSWWTDETFCAATCTVM